MTAKSWTTSPRRSARLTKKPSLRLLKASTPRRPRPPRAATHARATHAQTHARTDSRICSYTYCARALTVCAGALGMDSDTCTRCRTLGCRDPAWWWVFTTPSSLGVSAVVAASGRPSSGEEFPHHTGGTRAWLQDQVMETQAPAHGDLPGVSGRGEPGRSRGSQQMAAATQGSPTGRARGGARPPKDEGQGWRGPGKAKGAALRGPPLPPGPRHWPRWARNKRKGRRGDGAGGQG